MIRRALMVLWAAMVCAGTSEAQDASTPRIWVVFRDKCGAVPHLSNASALGITERALQRRRKVLPPDRLIDELDLPVAPGYVDRLRALGVVIHSTSRWLNAVSVAGSPDRIARIVAESFVADVKRVPVSTRMPEADPVPATPTVNKSTATTISYGVTLAQHTRTKVVDLHALGINGSGVLLGMQDDGFNYHRTHLALKHLPVIAEYDFVQRDSNTSIAPGEYASQGVHGRNCLSIAAGFANGTLSGGQSIIGPAYGVSVVLAKTEIDSVEIHLEEDNYVEALEWMERLGADIVSTSLGYDNFDPGGYNADDIFYWKKDGRTGTTSKAAAIAARKGVLLVTAMGNEGWTRKDSTWSVSLSSTGSLITPADADSILSVGAVDNAGILANFSSTGPTVDGRIKPEVVNQGVTVYYANGSVSGYSAGNGTSYATPLTAGAAALVLSAHPELAPMQVREALMNTAIRDIVNSQASSYPNNYYGWGQVNALEAALYWGTVFSNLPGVSSNDSVFVVKTKILSKAGLLADSLFLYFKKTGSAAFTRVALTATATPHEYQVIVRRTLIDSTAVGYFYARDLNGKVRTSPANPTDSLFVLRPTDTVTNITGPVPRIIPAEFLLQSYPNPFNPKVTLRVDGPADENVEVAVFNTLGQRVATLFQGPFVGATAQFDWYGTDGRGTSVAAGIYIVRLQTSRSTTSSKLVYLK